MRANDFADLQQLLSRYCHIVDAKSWDDLGQIFTEDGSMTVTGIYPVHTGLAALKELYGVKMRHPIAHNSTSVVVIADEGDRLRVESKFITVRSTGLCGTGLYEDVVVRTPAGWRIQTRLATPFINPTS